MPRFASSHGGRAQFAGEGYRVAEYAATFPICQVPASQCRAQWALARCNGQDGKRLATASEDHTAKVWDAESGKELLTLRGHSSFVSGVAFSADGRRLATASHDQTAKVWDAESGKELLTLRGHSEWISGVAFSLDGKRLATAGYDQTAKLWDAQSGKELLTLPGRNF